MYDAAFCLYAFSLLFAFVDLSGPSGRAKRAGTELLAVVWGLQTACLIVQWMNRTLSMLAMFDVLFFFSWLILSASLLFGRWFRMNGVIVFLMNLAGFAVMAFTFLSHPEHSSPLREWKAADDLLLIHVTLAVSSYAAFLIAALLSGMYLFLHRRLKERRWSALIGRYPSLENMSAYAYRFVAAGSMLLVLALGIGLVWIMVEGRSVLLLDPKVVNSFLVLAMYGFYLLCRAWSQPAGTRLAVLNLAAFSFVLLNFLLSNYVSGFHQWIWG